MKKTVYKHYAIASAKMYYRLLENENWAEDAQKLKNNLKTFMKKKRRHIEFNADWEFNMVYGILYPKPIRIILRLNRYLRNKLKKNKSH